MLLTFGKFKIQNIATIADAKRLHAEMIDETQLDGRGSSDLTRAELNATLTEGDELVGVFSYNSRLWLEADGERVEVLNALGRECGFSGSCKNTAEFNVIHAAVGKQAGFVRLACRCCAERIGSQSKQGAVIDMPNMQNTFYKLEAL